MKRTPSVSRLRSILLLVTLFGFLPVLARADKWTEPTPEELQMTSQREVPGASAVYLYREEITDDKMHMFGIYIRLKILTEKGKDYSNVELEYARSQNGGGYTVNDISGRTIHSDGTVIPFTGKPYDKLIEKNQGNKYMAKVFTLPDVQVGSIIEYRYTLRYDDHYFIAPKWYIQSGLYTRKAHYLWKPTGEQLVSSDDRGQLTNTIAWTPILPKGTEVKETRAPGNEGQVTLQVDLHDVPPAPEEEFMPPISSLTYRVLFYYSPYRSNEEFWKNEGKHWSKLQDKFIGPGPEVRSAVQKLVSPSDSQDQKLRKIYASVMEMENTDFTRQHLAAEEKAQGLKEIRNTDDILTRKRGDSDQLADLFVAMARAAGMKAYVMTVVNRDRHIFLQSYFTLSQFDDNIAIVNVDGKEQSFDPGSRYCPYGHLAWKHSDAGGMRQTDGGTVLLASPSEPFNASRVQRVANLTMDEHGQIAGTVRLIYTGAPALRWRQVALRGDEATVNREMLQSVEHMMPGGLEVKVASVEKLAEYEQPLTALFNVKGGIGSLTGKRMLLPGELFEANSKPTFTHDKRDVAVYFDYGYLAQDAIRLNFPTSMSVESMPVGDSFQFKKYALYSLKSEATPTSVTVRRDFAVGSTLFLVEEYPELRAFYNRLETKDQESLVLKLATAPKTAGSGN